MSGGGRAIRCALRCEVRCGQEKMCTVLCMQKDALMFGEMV